MAFSAGVNSDLGLVAVIAFKKKNFDYADVPERFAEFFEGTAFTGGGQNLNLTLQPGTQYSRYQLAFTLGAVPGSQATRALAAIAIAPSGLPPLIAPVRRSVSIGRVPKTTLACGLTNQAKIIPDRVSAMV